MSMTTNLEQNLLEAMDDRAATFYLNIRHLFKCGMRSSYRAVIISLKCKVFQCIRLNVCCSHSNPLERIACCRNWGK